MEKNLLTCIIDTLKIKKKYYEDIEMASSERNKIKLSGKIEATEDIIKYLRILAKEDIQ